MLWLRSTASSAWGRMMYIFVVRLEWSEIMGSYNTPDIALQWEMGNKSWSWNNSLSAGCLLVGSCWCWTVTTSRSCCWTLTLVTCWTWCMDSVNRGVCTGTTPTVDCTSPTAPATSPSTNSSHNIHPSTPRPQSPSPTTNHSSYNLFILIPNNLKKTFFIVVYRTLERTPYIWTGALILADGIIGLWLQYFQSAKKLGVFKTNPIHAKIFVQFLLFRFFAFAGLS